MRRSLGGERCVDQQACLLSTGEHETQHIVGRLFVRAYVGVRLAWYSTVHSARGGLSECDSYRTLYRPGKLWNGSGSDESVSCMLPSLVVGRGVGRELRSIRSSRNLTLATQACYKLGGG